MREILTFYFACNFVYATGQMSYGLSDLPGVNISRITDRRGKLLGHFEQLAGWLLEASSMIQLKDLTQYESASIAQDTQNIGDMLYSNLEKMFINCSNQYLQEISVEERVYECYCQILLRIITRFGELYEQVNGEVLPLEAYGDGDIMPELVAMKTTLLDQISVDSQHIHQASHEFENVWLDAIYTLVQKYLPPDG